MGRQCGREVRGRPLHVCGGGGPLFFVFQLVPTAPPLVLHICCCVACCVLGRGDLLSPWFRLISLNLLPKWWACIEAGTLDTCVQADTIHRAEEWVAAAAAAPAGAPGSDVKQGAYGKVPIHKHSILSQLLHVDEVWAVLKMVAKREKVSSLGPDASPSEVWCEEKLVQVSRSFAMVIRQLPVVRKARPPTPTLPDGRMPLAVAHCSWAGSGGGRHTPPATCGVPACGCVVQGLRSAICNFYLALRGLDTVEDDMENFPQVADKIAHLKRFHTYLRDPSWHLNGGCAAWAPCRPWGGAGVHFPGCVSVCVWGGGGRRGLGSPALAPWSEASPGSAPPCPVLHAPTPFPCLPALGRHRPGRRA